MAASPKPRHFEFVKGTSRKFWSVTTAGASVTVRFGRIGTDGQEKTKSFADGAAAARAAEALVREKVGKGYAEVKGKGGAPKAAATPKPAPAAAAPAVHRAASPDAEIVALEKTIQYRLPPALYAYFRSSLRGPAGEIRHDPSLRAPIYEFLDAGGALQNWNVMTGIDDWDREWVPIAWDGAGNLHFVHAKKGTVGFACQDPHGRKHGKLPLERWLGQWNIELETFARKVAPLAAPPAKKTRGGTISDLWGAFEKWLDGHERGPRFKASLNPGASDAAIAAAGQRLGFDFPPDLRDLYRGHDGQNANKGAFIGREGTKLYPLKKVTNASHARLTERHLIIGGGKGDSKTTWLLTYDKKTGALELFAPDLDRYSRRPVAKSLRAWMEELVTGLPKSKVTLQSSGSFTWWGR